MMPCYHSSRCPSGWAVRLPFCSVVLLAALGGPGLGLAQSSADKPQSLEHAAIEGADVLRRGRQLLITPHSQDTSGQVTVPRLATSIGKLQWVDQADDQGLTLKPEPEYWILAWSKRPEGAQTIVVECDLPPLLLSEVQPQQPVGDGSVYLPACLATTDGKKIRFEPQSYKNTVGYWTGKSDTASWQFELAQAGEFNVGLLQGCGMGQGGSRARLRIENAQQQQVAELELEVLETGHFQNFQWRQLGSLQLPEAGVYRLTIEPISIHKAALMDVRAVHLIRLP